MSHNPFLNPFLGAHQKTQEQKRKENREKVCEDLGQVLDRMTPEERKQFWAEHDKDTERE